MSGAHEQPLPLSERPVGRLGGECRTCVGISHLMEAALPADRRDAETVEQAVTTMSRRYGPLEILEAPDDLLTLLA